MIRSILFCAVCVAAYPAIGRAQFAPAMVPPNPLYQHPAYQYQFNLGASVPTAFGRTFVGVTHPFTRAPQSFSYNLGRPLQTYAWSPRTGTSSGYMTGGNGLYDSYSAQRDFEKAQRDARVWGNPDAAKNLISDQWAYEKLGIAPGAAGPGQPKPDALIRAIGVTSEGDVASGEALNQILAAIAIAEAKGGKGVSAYLAPQVLDEVRFAGASGAALNLLRQSGRLSIPVAFAADQLRDLRDTLEVDFASATAPILAGKPSESAKWAKVELTLKRLEDASPPVLRELSFEDAIAARRFLNQFAAGLKTLKSGNLTGLLNRAWTTEGTSVADLVKHMLKHKLQFGPAPAGSEPAYLVLHKGLVTYLFVLTQDKK